MPLINLLEIHLQKGSVHCICSSVSRQSAESDFGVAVGSGESWGVVSGIGLGVTSEAVQLLVLNTAPSVEEAVSMLSWKEV